MFCSNCGTKIGESAQFCQNCGTKAGKVGATKAKENSGEKDSGIEYFAISPQRLALFSIITFGIYEIYWFYKNWQAVKKFEGQDISPFWRAVFAVFFCYSLFKKVLESAKNHAYRGSYSAGWLAAAYILLLLGGNGLSRVETYDIGFNLVWLLVVSAAFIPLLPVQKAINFNNEKIKGATDIKKGFSGGEVALIVVGVIWTLLVLWGTFLP